MREKSCEHFVGHRETACILSAFSPSLLQLFSEKTRGIAIALAAKSALMLTAALKLTFCYISAITEHIYSGISLVRSARDWDF